MALTINPTASVISVQATGSAMPGVVLQPGTVVNAQVVAAAENLVQIAIAGLTIDVLSEIPLYLGQNLKLAVSQPDSSTIRLAVVGQGTAGAGATVDASSLASSAQIAAAATSAVIAPAPSDPLTPLERIAVSVASESAAAQQESLGPLFADLSTVAATPGLPPALQQAIVQVLAQQTSLDPNLTGADVQTAFQKSGLFLEASLTAGPPPLAGTPDLKAALIVLRQTLAASLGTPEEQATATAIVAPSPGEARSAPVVKTTTSPMLASSQSPEISAHELLLPQPRAAPASAAPATAAPANAAPASAAPASAAPANAAPANAAPASAAPANAAPASAAPATAAPANAAPANAAPANAAPANAAAANAAALVSTSKLLSSGALLDLGPKSVTSGAPLNLWQEALQEIPRAADKVSIATVTLQDGRSAGAIIRTNTPPPPFRGALPSAQAVAAPSITQDAPLATTLRHLLGDTDAALARQTLLQVASLPDRTDHTGSRVDPSQPRWNFEVPFATPQGTAMAQFEISRDGGGSEIDPAKRVWRVRFSLDIEPAGPVHALIAYSGERTSVRMWAERPQTAAQLRAGAAELSQALSKAELSPGDIVIREGTPPIMKPAKAGHFLDRAL
jgi:Flagellar hook-length control protein FliK